MSKIWQCGDIISFELLNRLQEKADKYDELMAKDEKKENTGDKKPGKATKKK